MSAPLNCWKCSAGLKDVPLPIGRTAVCLACRAELHVCRQCRHYDTGKAKQCRELAADDVRDKTRANFCDWFQPKAAGGAGAGGNDPAAQARAELDKLFG